MATLVLGGEHDSHEVEADGHFEVDHDVDSGGGFDVDADADADADADHDGAFDAVLGWLPITSLRFWTYFSAFFGLTGTALTTFELMDGPKPIALAAGLMGYAAGFSIVRILTRLRTADATSGIRANDFVGRNAKVRVRVHGDEAGQVRLRAVNGRVIDLMARTEDGEFAVNQDVMIYAVTDDGGVMVTKAQAMEKADVTEASQQGEGQS